MNQKTEYSGFFYHTEVFEAEEVAQKCAAKMEEVPNNIEEIIVRDEGPVEMDTLFDSKFAQEWLGPNYEGDSVTFDVPYPELNEDSRERESEFLIEKRGQFIYFIADVQGNHEQKRISGLVEIRGRVEAGKVEFYVEEYVLGDPGFESSPSTPQTKGD